MVVIGCYETRNYLTLEYGEVYKMCDPSSPKIPVENGVYLKEIHPVEQKIRSKISTSAEESVELEALSNLCI